VFHIDGFDCAGGVEVHPEVLVVEDSLARVVGGVVESVSAAGGWLDEERFFHVAVASENHNPSVDTSAAVRVFGHEVGLVIVDCDLFELGLEFSLCCTGVLLVLID